MISTIFPMLCLCFPSNYTYSMPGVFLYFNSKSLSLVVSKESPVSHVHSLVSEDSEWAGHFHNYHSAFLPPVLWSAVHFSTNRILLQQYSCTIQLIWFTFTKWLCSDIFFLVFKSLPGLYLFFWVHIIFVMVIMKTLRWKEHCLPYV